MPNSELLAVDSTQLSPEDQLWAGLRFEIIDRLEMPEQHHSVGDHVHYHRGVWWKQHNRLFCAPCSTFEMIDPDKSWPKWQNCIAGHMHLCPPGARSNATYRAIVNDEVKGYSLHSLGSKDNIRGVRRALDKVEVRIVSLDVLLDEGISVYESWHQRVGWGKNRSREGFSYWIRHACSLPKRMSLGAFVEGNLVAFMLPYATGNVICTSFIASHTDSLKFRPNDALFHAVLCIARQTPGITMADFGPLCGKPTLNNFKLRFGKVRKFPAYVRINRLLMAFAAKGLRDRYPWLDINTVN